MQPAPWPPKTREALAKVAMVSTSGWPLAVVGVGDDVVGKDLLEQDGLGLDQLHTVADHPFLEPFEALILE